MKNTNALFVVMAFLLPNLALAESIGVAEPNFSLSGNFSTFKNQYLDGSDSNSKRTLLSGSATLAIGQYGGASGFLKYGESSDSSFDLKQSEKTYGAIVFLRNAAIGRVGFAYDNGKTTIDNISNTNFLSSYRETTYTVLLDYYFNDFTLAVERFKVNWEFPVNFAYTSELNGSTLSAIWHIHENVLVRVSKYAMDYEDINSISLIYQPEVFDRSTSFTFKYLEENINPESGTKVSLFSINYYFGTRVSLKNRERKYSSYLYSNILNQI